MKIRKGLDFSTRDYEGFRHDMIEMLKKKIPEYSDFSQSDVGIVLIELLAYNLDILSYYNDKVANELFLDTAMERQSVARLAKMLGYKLKDSTPSHFKQVFEILPQENPYTIPRGYVIQTEESTAEQLIQFETDEPLVIPPHCNGLEQDENGEYLYAVNITQGFSVNGEIAGSSNGAPNQSFLLDYSPVIADSVEVYVNEGRGFERWTLKDNYLDSTASSHDFTLFIAEDGTGTIKFGNGVSGKIPDIRNNNIMVNYRVGGGTSGNVGVKTIVKMPQKLADIRRTFNPYEAHIKGRDKEDIEEARVKAPASIGTRYGLVTLDDFKNLALTVTGVLRANATKKEGYNTIVNVYYLSDGTINKQELEQTMTNLYGQRKLVGTHVILNEATYRPINIEVVAKTFNTFVGYDVKEQIIVTLQNLIQKGTYNFGESPEQSDLVTELLELDSIRAVDVTITGADNLRADEIVTLGELSVEVIGGR